MKAVEGTPGRASLDGGAPLRGERTLVAAGYRGECSECAGDGEALVWRPSGARLEPCPRCGGSGRVDEFGVDGKGLRP